MHLIHVQILLIFFFSWKKDGFVQLEIIIDTQILRHESWTFAHAQTSSVKVEHVSFRGIRGTSATEEAIRFACSDNFPCERISLGDIDLYNEGGNTSAFCWNAFGFSTGVVHPRPCFMYDERAVKNMVFWVDALLSFINSLSFCLLWYYAASLFLCKWSCP